MEVFDQMRLVVVPKIYSSLQQVGATTGEDSAKSEIEADSPGIFLYVQPQPWQKQAVQMLPAEAELFCQLINLYLSIILEDVIYDSIHHVQPEILIAKLFHKKTLQYIDPRLKRGIVIHPVEDVRHFFA